MAGQRQPDASDQADLTDAKRQMKLSLPWYFLTLEAHRGSPVGQGEPARERAAGAVWRLA
jgi:hypothetical protein